MNEIFLYDYQIPEIEHPIDRMVLESPRVAGLRQQLLELIPRRPSTAATITDLSKLSINRLIGVYMNWVDRLVPPRKRTVLEWDGFWSRNDPRQFVEQLDKIIKLSWQGGDLTPFLSTKVHTDGYVQKMTARKGIVWGDKDMALNTFEVHHFHLQPSNVKGIRKGQSNNLLFVSVSRTDLLLVMLGDHKSFDDGSLFQAVTDMRAEAGYILKGILPARNDSEPVEKQRLFRHGISTVGVSEGQAVMSGMISSAGTSVFHTRHADECCLTIEHFEPNIGDRKALANCFDIEVTELPSKPNWEWSFWYGDLLLGDRNTGICFRVVSWRR